MPDTILIALTVTPVKDFSEVVSIMLLEGDAPATFIPPTPDDSVSPSAQV